MKESNGEIAAQPSRLLRTLNDVGRCATCPSLIGVIVRTAVGEDGPARRKGECPDLFYGEIPDRMTTDASQGFATFYEEYAVCGRDEVPVGDRVYPRRLTWRQVGGQLLRLAGDRVVNLAAIVGATDRGDSDAAQAYTDAPSTPPPTEDTPPESPGFYPPIV